MHQDLPDLPTIGHESNPPDPTGTAAVFRRIGYSLDEAIADLIDNSIDARASNVLVRLYRRADRIHRVIVADDGEGMGESVLKKAMQYGVRTEHKSSDLGKYGIGLKSASFSQCRSLSVVSRKGRGTAGRRWTLRSIEAGWKQEVINPDGAATFLNQPWGDLDLSRSGTLVIWDDLDFVSHTSGKQGFETTLAGMIKELTINLGLRFHRFLESRALGITVETLNLDAGLGSIPLSIPPLNPFAHPVSGRDGFPTVFRVELGSGTHLNLEAHIWPAKSNDPNYKLGGGRVSARQGFYFYRNDRLIQPGGWNGLQSDTEPHYSLARVSIDLPPTLDSLFRLSVQKSKIDPPADFLAAVERARAGTTSFRDYLTAANDVYRSKQDTSVQTPIVPGKGIPSGLAKRAGKLLAPDSGGTREVAFTWTSLPESIFFDLDRDSGAILLNQRYRRAVLGGSRSSSADAPLVKSLLFLLAEDHLMRRRSSQAAERWLTKCNSLLVAAAKGSHG